MATQLFRGDEFVWVEPASIKNHLDQGWSFDDPNAPPVPGLDIVYPESLKGIENLPPEEQEKAVLQEMGIEVVNPEPTPPKKATKRRGRPRKNA